MARRMARGSLRIAIWMLSIGIGLIGVLAISLDPMETDGRPLASLSAGNASDEVLESRLNDAPDRRHGETTKLPDAEDQNSAVPSFVIAQSFQDGPIQPLREPFVQKKDTDNRTRRIANSGRLAVPYMVRRVHVRRRGFEELPVPPHFRAEEGVTHLNGIDDTVQSVAEVRSISSDAQTPNVVAAEQNQKHVAALVQQLEELREIRKQLQNINSRQEMRRIEIQLAELTQRQAEIERNLHELAARRRDFPAFSHAASEGPSHGTETDGDGGTPSGLSKADAEPDEKRMTAKLIRPEFLSADSILALIQAMLTPGQGRASTMPGSGPEGEARSQPDALLVVDFPEVLEQIEALVAELDVRGPEFEIEVVVTTLHNQSGSCFRAIDTLRQHHRCRSACTETMDETGCLDCLQFEGTASEVLELLQPLGTVQIESLPKIRVLNRQVGEIELQEEIAYRSQSLWGKSRKLSGETLDFLPSVTRLAVRPELQGSDMIRLRVEPEHSHLFLDPATHLPRLSRAGIKTDVMIPLGGTLVIGGLTHHGHGQHWPAGTRQEKPSWWHRLRKRRARAIDLTEDVEVIVLVTPRVISSEESSLPPDSLEGPANRKTGESGPDLLEAIERIDHSVPADREGPSDSPGPKGTGEEQPSPESATATDQSTPPIYQEDSTPDRSAPEEQRLAPPVSQRPDWEEKPGAANAGTLVPEPL